MTWHPPFFTCGECGGEIGRWPVRNLLRQDILDWRHREVPPYSLDGGATVPHRPVLGTKAHTPRIPEVRTVATEGPRVAPPPETPARPALAGDLPGPAQQTVKLAESHGWTVQAWIMRGTLMSAEWRPNRVITTVALWMDRDGHRLVSSWATRTEKEDEDLQWDFEGAWSLGRFVEPLGGPALKAALRYPRAVCVDCGKVPAFHVLTDGTYVCQTEPTPTEGVAP